MLKKLFVTAAAAAAVSVPLAGVALADTGDPNGNGLGQGGVPQRLGDFAATGVTPPLADCRTTRFLPARNSTPQRTFPPL